MIHYDDGTVTLHLGDALEAARTMPDGFARTIVTSPPYYGLRDYGEGGQYGGESSVHEYVETMTNLFRELRRVLADDGTLWLNLGDSYTGSWGAQSREAHAGIHTSVVESGQYATKHGRTGSRRDGEPPAKNLLGVPWRVAFALQEDGWFLRSDIIWAKPNPMPSSVRDRVTSSHEYIFMLSKSARYYFNAEAISEPVADSTASRLAQPGLDEQAGSTRANGGRKTNGAMKAVGPRFGGAKYGDHESPEHRTKSGNEYVNTGRANKRDVWTVATVPFSEAHFAVYPPELIRPCILAGSEPGDVVLDPFSGSGTTGMVATEEGRRYVGIDLNADFLDLSLRTRFAQPTLGIAITA